jgi:mono/diheme cytochrome c family protein
MSTPDMSRLKTLLAAGAAVALAATAAAQTKGVAKGPNLGQPATAADIAAWDIDIPPSGRGLPPGSGTPARGEAVYKQHCASCHGPKGEGKPNDRLVGGQGSLPGDKPAIKTVGSYWPYATTVFDYVRRSMPWHAPQSLASDDVYAVTAYILMLDNIIGPDDVMDAKTLPAVKMPNRDGFRSHYKARK